MRFFISLRLNESIFALSFLFTSKQLSISRLEFSSSDKTFVVFRNSLIVHFFRNTCFFNFFRVIVIEDCAQNNKNDKKTDIKSV